MSQIRQLAAIMFTDIVGYTLLMGNDEQQAFNLLRINRGIHKPIIEQLNGHLIKEMGDGVMASFNNVSDAVNAAIKIQEACIATKEFQLRIGIHYGEVVFEQDDVFGDAVNIASRIQSLAIPGSILFSHKVQEELKNKSQFEMISLGNFEFKNVANPIEVFALSYEGFLVPDIISMRGKIKNPKIQPIKLFAILSNFLQAASTVFAGKEKVSGKGSIKVTHKNITTNPIAYEWFKKSEYRLTPENKADVDKCIYCLKKAIEADPSFALAHAELSQAYSYLHYWIEPKAKYNEKAFMEAEKSLFINPDLAEGYFAKAFSLWNFQNKFPHELTIREYKKAIALKPDLDDAYHYLAAIYSHVGLMEESFENFKKAIQINPYNKITSLHLAQTYFFTGKKSDLEKMITFLKETPEHLISLFNVSTLAIAHTTHGRYKEAEEILNAGLKKDPSDLFMNSAFAVYLAKTGDKAGALEKIELCEKSNLNTGHVHHAVYNLAVTYALLNEYQKSVNKLIWVAENGFPNYIVFRDDVLLENLHQFPPYHELLKKLKISWNRFKQIANE